MKWIPEDIDTFLQAKEYVDTIALPLLPVSFENDIKQVAAMSEFISLLTVQLERQFKGRLLMLPGYTYLKTLPMANHISCLAEWEAVFKDNEFKHIFYVTSDVDWKNAENQLQGEVIWLPTLPLEHMEEKYRDSILEDQVKQLLNLFVQKWKPIE